MYPFAAVARLTIMILTASVLQGCWGIRIGDEGEKAAFLQSSLDAPILDKIANFVLSKDPVELKAKGITLGDDENKPVDCEGDSETGLGVSTTVVKCTVKNIVVKQPPPAGEHKNFTLGDNLLTIDRVFLHVECDMGAVMELVGHQIRTAALGWMGSWGQEQITGYQGKTMCKVKEVELHNTAVRYETGLKLTSTSKTPDFRKVLSADAYQTSNVNMLAKLFLPNEDPEEPVEPLPGTDPVNWQDARFQLNKITAWANGKEINYNRDFNKDLKMLIGSNSKGMLKLFLALGKLVRNIVYDTVKGDLGEAADAVVDGVVGAGRAVARTLSRATSLGSVVGNNKVGGFFSKSQNSLTALFNRADNDKCCCMLTNTCKKIGWSSGDNAIKFGFEIDGSKYCCKIRDYECDTDKYNHELLPLLENLADSQDVKILHQGSRSRNACPAAVFGLPP